MKLTLSVGMLLASCACAIADPLPALNYTLVSTDITGAQTQIDIDHTSSWTFSPTVAWSLKGGTFVMKDGSQTAASLVLSLYENGGTTAVTSLTLTNADFHTQNTSDQSFSDVSFFFDPLFTLNAGSSYTLKLTSTAVDAQSKAYFIKGNAWTFQDPNGGSIDPGLLGDPITTDGLATTGGTTATPEPGTWAMAFGGLAVAVVARRRAARSTGSAC